MAIYEFKCCNVHCNQFTHINEIEQPINLEHVHNCEECGEKCARLYTHMAFSLTGDGWASKSDDVRWSDPDTVVKRLTGER